MADKMEGGNYTGKPWQMPTEDENASLRKENEELRQRRTDQFFELGQKNIRIGQLERDAAELRAQVRLGEASYQAEKDLRTAAEDALALARKENEGLRERGEWLEGIARNNNKAYERQLAGTNAAIARATAAKAESAGMREALREMRHTHGVVNDHEFCHCDVCNLADTFLLTRIDALLAPRKPDSGECRSCVDGKCTTGPECVTHNRDKRPEL